MHQFIVVTHEGPCMLEKSVYDQVVNMKKQDRKFSDQILFALHLADLGKIDIRVQWGKMPKVGSFGEFIQRFIMQDPPARRNIIV